MVRLARTVVSRLALTCCFALACNDDGGDDTGNETGAATTATPMTGSDDHATESGGHEASETAHDDDAPAVCAEITTACHDLGEEMGGEYEACHEIGHDADEAACMMAYDDCIALCTGAGTGGSAGSGGSSGADGSGSGSGSGG